VEEKNIRDAIWLKSVDWRWGKDTARLHQGCGAVGLRLGDSRDFVGCIGEDTRKVI
jgi:hypothetical protein